jgi:hypothetical protein
LKGNGDESVVAILRLQCGSPWLHRLMTVSFGPDGKVLILY